MYRRLGRGNGIYDIIMCLVTTRVASLSSVSISRPELHAAVLAVKMLRSVKPTPSKL